ncbi:hypothetical protein DN069_14110 [Streptacidiphilus pinicola]|uniref:ATP-dependent helicase n=2 Tax=Streptacidiphilus pinicola TaxID=2219663 RepID=A0A2X0KCM9_9ACTN|nr:hypothetical protein DN069_14110 [Streptacidiphilus pinicola]
MGLGKTVQAIAALSHLAADGERHFVVVCPAGVLVNWLREIESRSTLAAFRLHGPDRALAHRAWRERGGVAVTTFEGLRHLDAARPTEPPRVMADHAHATAVVTDALPVPVADTSLTDAVSGDALLTDAVSADAARSAAEPADATPWAAGAPAATPVAMTVVDEAHYVKNPTAQRARHVAALVERSSRALFLTGTPMENRVAEFRALLGYLQPELVAGLHEADQLAGAAAFRRAVAPAYLRRNQADVLTELPEVVHTDEWAEFSAADAEAYREAVRGGNLQAMRRAAYSVPERSAKLDRLTELVGEATSAGEKVLVFSYYRQTLGAVRGRLGRDQPGLLFGPLSGATGATARQETVDEFTDHRGPAILLCQIQAGGLGLNLQAANVVILCEPQIKPALEQQAVARAHRMGQTRRVRVHRLLTPDSVDQRLLTLLGRKERLFDAYARRSEAAESSPDAVDVADTGLARQIIEEEQQRLAMTPHQIS